MIGYKRQFPKKVRGEENEKALQKKYRRQGLDLNGIDRIVLLCL